MTADVATGLVIAAVFINLFATVFNGLIIARMVLGLFVMPTNWLLRQLVALTEPLLIPIRRVMPAPGGLDFSPTFAIIALYLLSALASSLLNSG